MSRTCSLREVLIALKKTVDFAIIKKGDKMPIRGNGIRVGALLLVMALIGVFCFSTWASEPRTSNSGDTDKAALLAIDSGNDNGPGVLEQEQVQPLAKIARKHFPWLVVAVGTVLAGAIIYLAFIKPTKHLLIVEMGAGANGTPAAGKYWYKKGEKVAYNFTCADGYKNLVVFVDDIAASPSAIIVMNRAHKIRVETTQSAEYSLAVNAENGINGSPASGTYSYREGTSVAYNYVLADGYVDLQVKLDNVQVAANGTVKMDRDHVLVVTAGRQYYNLKVTLTAGVTGTPAAGTHGYEPGTRVAYSYALAAGYFNLRVMLDGVQLSAQGSVGMEFDHNLEVSAELIRPANFDVQGRWRIWQTSSTYMFMTQEMIFSGTSAAGKIYRPNSSSYIGEYIVSADQIKFWAYTDYAHSTDFTGTLRNANNMDGPCFRNPCDLPDGVAGTWAAVRVQ
jgi:hypothetical protein